MFINRRYLFVILSMMFVLQLTAACFPSERVLEGEHWVIFSAEHSKELKVGDWLVGNGKSIEYWTPTEQNVLDLENEVAAFLQENSDRFYSQDTPVWERLDEYERQYVGLILDGKNIVYANYFCNSTGTDWKQDFVFIMDGGACYFQFKYDADSGELFDLQVNGEA